MRFPQARDGQAELPSRVHLSSRSPSAVAIAVSTARALCRVSASSVAGSLSATIPAPACTYARPFASTMVRMVMHESRLPLKPK